LRLAVSFLVQPGRNDTLYQIYRIAHQADSNWSSLLAGLAFINWYEAKRNWRTQKEEAIQSRMDLTRRANQIFARPIKGIIFFYNDINE
jgi:hypothetical protein